MTEQGDPYENAIAERVNGILKTEFEISKTFATLELAEQATLAKTANMPKLQELANMPKRAKTEEVKD